MSNALPVPWDLTNPGCGKGKINIFFAGSGYSHDLLYSVGGRKRLISWHANSDDELDEFRFSQYRGERVFSIVDSGAFSVWNKGGSINVDEYATKLIEFLQFFSYGANLDVIPGKKGMPASEITKQITEDAASQGWNNYLRICEVLRANGCSDFCRRVMPIYHQGESLDWLKRMVDYGCDYVGVSPSNDYHTNQRMHWLDDVYTYLRRQPEMLKTHGYAVTSPTLMESYPWFSVDSASWIQAGGFGTVMTPFGNITLTDREESMAKPDSFGAAKWSPEMMIKVENYFNSIGLSIEELKKDYKARWKANAIHLLKYESEYVYQPKPQQDNLFEGCETIPIEPKNFVGEVRMTLYDATKK